MRWLINYIRSCFCKHDWEKLKEASMMVDDYELPVGTKWIYRCRKCRCNKKFQDY